MAEKGKAEITHGLSPQATEWLRYNITGDFSSKYDQLAKDAKEYGKVMDNEFKRPNERAEAAEKYRDVLLEVIKNLDSGIAELKKLEGNFRLSFSGEAKEFAKYVANLEQTRANTVGMLWRQTEKALGEGTLTKITLPMPKGMDVEALERKYPAYRFEEVAINLESNEASIMITRPVRRDIDVVDFEGKVAPLKPKQRDIYTKFE